MKAMDAIIDGACRMEKELAAKCDECQSLFLEVETLRSYRETDRKELKRWMDIAEDLKDESKAMEESRNQHAKRAKGLVDDLCNTTKDYLGAKARAEMAEWTRLIVSIALIIVSASIIIKLFQ